MRLLITRHGETYDNIRRIIQGQSHGRLTEKGEGQAKMLGKRLSDLKVDAIYSSDLKRAKHTAEIISRETGVPVFTDERLRERDFGGATGLPFTWDSVRKFEEEHAGTLEPFDAMVARLSAVVDELQVKYPSGTVLIVSHGLAMKLLIGHLEGRSLEDSFDLHLENASLSMFDILDGKAERVLLNCTGHLD